MIILGILRSCLVSHIILQLLGLCNTTSVGSYNLETNHKMVFSVLLKMYDPNSNSSPISRLIDPPSRVDAVEDYEFQPKKPRLDTETGTFSTQDRNLPSLVNILGDDECHPKEPRPSEVDISLIQDRKLYANNWKKKILSMDNTKFSTFYLEQECYPTVEEYVKIMSVLTSDDQEWVNDAKLSEWLERECSQEGDELVKRVLEVILSSLRNQPVRESEYSENEIKNMKDKINTIMNLCTKLQAYRKLCKELEKGLTMFDRDKNIIDSNRRQRICDEVWGVDADYPKIGSDFRVVMLYIGKMHGLKKLELKDMEEGLSEDSFFPPPNLEILEYSGKSGDNNITVNLTEELCSRLKSD